MAGLIYPQLVGRKLQKIEEMQDGTLRIHTAAGYVQIAANRDGLYYGFVPAKERPDTLVVKG